MRKTNVMLEIYYTNLVLTKEYNAIVYSHLLKIENKLQQVYFYSILLLRNDSLIWFKYNTSINYKQRL